MTQDELISRQALKVAEQADKIEDLERRLKQIHMILFCCGGPLNDNVLGYTKEQRVTFHRIAELTE